MMLNIYKDRQDKQAQMQAEAAAKANEALAAYRGSQKNQTDALTPVKVQTEKERGNAAAAQAALSTSKKETEDALRGKRENYLMLKLIMPMPELLIIMLALTLRERKLGILIPKQRDRIIKMSTRRRLMISTPGM